VGVRLGNWLTAEQAKALLHAPDIARVRGKRDHAMLAVLLGCADCVDPNSSTSVWIIFSREKITGPLST
jgi:hypothetical protein